jgi:hypothetical protein
MGEKFKLPASSIEDLDSVKLQMRFDILKKSMQKEK